MIQERYEAKHGSSVGSLQKSGKMTFDVDRELVEAFYKEEEQNVH